MSDGRLCAIRGGQVLRPDLGSAEPADLLIRSGEILEIGRSGLAAPDGAEIVDATGFLLHPGLVNGHTHGHGNYSRGLTDDVTLELLLAAGGWFSGGRTHEDKYLSTAIGAAEMVLKGCTACLDLFYEAPTVSSEGMQAAGQAYHDVGMRAVVCPMVADYPFFRSIPGLREALPPDLQREVDAVEMPGGEIVLSRLADTIRAWPFARDRVRLGLGPTIPLLCTDAFMRGSAALAREHGLVFQTHLSESKVQEVTARRRWGRSLTAYLDGLGILGPDMSAAHGVWLDDEDMARLGEAGVSVIVNAGSNLRLGSGLPAMRRLLDRGVNVGIGTDSSSCSDNQNMYEAMRLAGYVSHVQSPEPRDWVTAREAAVAATEGSARALGFDRIGRLAPGYRADIVFLDLDWVHWMSIRNALTQFVQAEDATAVRHVMVDGAWVVRDRRLVSFDLDALRPKVAAAIARLEETTVPARDFYRRLEPVVGSFCAALARTPHHVHRFGGCWDCEPGRSAPSCTDA